MAALDRTGDDTHADLLDLFALGGRMGAVPISIALIGWFWPKGTPEDEA
jgi:hypothetical protein